ncbi:MAG: radical SAM protein [Anaerolineales bacterium]|nr:radical SAM protein [Anaerolineales bacterium]
MRILLLSPGQLKGYRRFDSNHPVFPIIYPRLGIRILAALTPASHEVSIIEGDRTEGIDFDQEVDLVGISVLTPHAIHAYRIADEFRSRNKVVILGGPHPTLNASEAKRHADAVVVGEAELVWLPLLQDVQQGNLKPYYQSDGAVLWDEIPSPLRLASDDQHYSTAFPIETGRGCRIGCEFCLVGEMFGTAFNPRPVEQVIQEIETAKRLVGEAPAIIFSENLLGNPTHAKEFCKRIAPLRVDWSAEGDFYHFSDEEYLDLIQQAGCCFIYIETKMVSRRVNPRLYDLYGETIDAILKRDIPLSINFTVGYDDHDEALVMDTIEFISKGNIAPYSSAQILVPWPGTPLFQRLEREGRILTRNWASYNNRSLVFQPKNFSIEAFMSMYLELQKQLRVLKLMAIPSVSGVKGS